MRREAKYMEVYKIMAKCAVPVPFGVILEEYRKGEIIYFPSKTKQRLRAHLRRLIAHGLIALTTKVEGFKYFLMEKEDMKSKNWQDFFSDADQRKITDARKKDINIFMAVSDLFAIGCYLISKQNNYNAGRKACKTAMEALAVDGTLKAKILGKLEGSSLQMFNMFSPHTEILNLFEKK